MQIAKENAHGRQADARKQDAKSHLTTSLDERQRSHPLNCSACGKPTSTPKTFTLVPPLDGAHDVYLCQPCVRGLHDRAIDPILIDDDKGFAFAGGMVRRISSRIASQKKTGAKVRPVVALDDSADGGII